MEDPLDVVGTQETLVLHPHVYAQELLQFRWAQENLDGVANLLIPIRGTDGVVVIGQNTICFLAHNAVVSTSMPSTIIKAGSWGAVPFLPAPTDRCMGLTRRHPPIPSLQAYGAVDREGTRFLLGDFRGELLLLVLQRDGPSKRCVAMLPQATALKCRHGPL